MALSVFSPAPSDADHVRYVDTVADMLALTDVRDGVEVQTARYSVAHVAGDGSGGEYVYHATGRSGITADGGFFHNGAGADDYWELKDQTVANVMQFGAYSGASAATNTTAFTSAIAALPAKTGIGTILRPTRQGVLRIPDGNYLLNTLTIPNTKSIRVVGDSMGGSVLESNGVDYIFDLTTATDNQRIVAFESLTFFEGGLKVGDSYRRFGRINDCQFIECPDYAIWLGDGVVEWRMEKVIVSECENGILLQGTGANQTDLIHMSNMQMIRNTGPDIIIDGCQSWLMDYSDFEVKPTPSAAPFVLVTDTGCPLIRNGTFRNVRFGNENQPPDTLIQLGETVGSTVAKDIKFQFCDFQGNTQNTTTSVVLGLNRQPQRIKFLGCTVKNYVTLISEDFPTVIGNTQSMSDNYISDCVFENEEIELFSGGGRSWKINSGNTDRLGFGRHDAATWKSNLLTSDIDGFIASNTTVTTGTDTIDGNPDVPIFTLSATADGSASVRKAVAVPGAVTFSAWIKSDTVTQARLAVLGTGNLFETSIGEDLELSTDWKRYSVTTLVTGSRTATFYLYIKGREGGVLTGDAIKVAGAQINAGYSPSPYVTPGASVGWGGPYRKQLLDAVGNIDISQTFNFDSGNGDTKTATLTDDTAITLTATRPGMYWLLLRGDDGITERLITWSTSVSGSPPASVTSSTYTVIQLFWDGATWHSTT